MADVKPWQIIEAQNRMNVTAKGQEVNSGELVVVNVPAPIYQYVDGKRTDTVTGSKFTAVSVDDGEYSEIAYDVRIDSTNVDIKRWDVISLVNPYVTRPRGSYSYYYHADIANVVGHVELKKEAK